MRYIILAAVLLCAAPAAAQTRYHETYSRPLWVFYEYPKGIPANKYDAKTPGYKYYPYSYRTDYPRDGYNRNKSARYPVR